MNSSSISVSLSVFSMFFMSFSRSLFIDSSPCRFHLLSSLLLWFKTMFSGAVDSYIRLRSKVQRLSLSWHSVACVRSSWRVGKSIDSLLVGLLLGRLFFYVRYFTEISQFLDDNLGLHRTMKLVVVETSKKEVRIWNSLQVHSD